MPLTYEALWESLRAVEMGALTASEVDKWFNLREALAFICIEHGYSACPRCVQDLQQAEVKVKKLETLLASMLKASEELITEYHKRDGHEPTV